MGSCLSHRSTDIYTLYGLDNPKTPSKKNSNSVSETTDLASKFNYSAPLYPNIESLDDPNKSKTKDVPDKPKGYDVMDTPKKTDVTNKPGKPKRSEVTDKPKRNGVTGQPKKIDSLEMLTRAKLADIKEKSSLNDVSGNPATTPQKKKKVKRLDGTNDANVPIVIKKKKKQVINGEEVDSPIKKTRKKPEVNEFNSDTVEVDSPIKKKKRKPKVNEFKSAKDENGDQKEIIEINSTNNFSKPSQKEATALISSTKKHSSCKASDDGNDDSPFHLHITRPSPVNGEAKEVHVKSSVSQLPLPRRAKSHKAKPVSDNADTNLIKLTDDEKLDLTPSINPISSSTGQPTKTDFATAVVMKVSPRISNKVSTDKETLNDDPPKKMTFLEPPSPKRKAQHKKKSDYETKSKLPSYTEAIAV